MPTPPIIFDLISQPVIRFVLGWDLVDRDVCWVQPRDRDADGRPMTCLEVGAGGGFFSAGLKRHLGPGSTLVTLDLSHEAMHRLVQRAAKRDQRIVGVAGDAFRLPFADGTVDCVFYSYSLEEVPDPVASLRESARVLRPGGQLVLFLWKPIARRRMRAAVDAFVDGHFDRVIRSSGPQNVRLSARRTDAPVDVRSSTPGVDPSTRTASTT
jgi:ubiquinone/menaquinone biosynthesis C-methylase UbiE